MEFKKKFKFLGIYDRSYNFESNLINRYQIDFYDDTNGSSLSFNIYSNDKTKNLIDILLSLVPNDIVTVVLYLTEKEKDLYKLNLKDIEVD